MGVWLAKNYGWIIITVLLVLILVLAIYFKGRKDGASGFLSDLFGGEAIPSVPDFPGEPSDLQGIIENIALRIEKYANGWNPFHNDDMCASFEDALGLPDEAFMNLVDYYQSTYGKSLYDEIDETWSNCVNLTPNWGDYKQMMLDRIVQLSLSIS